MPATVLASFPSPAQSVWHVGPVPIRAYALCIIAGIVAAIWIGEKRWVARGGRRGTVSDVAVWAVIFGLVGGRLYHVVTDNELYFRDGRDPWRALAVWEGGLGIWGAIALGGVGAWIGCRRAGIQLPPFADAVAPGIAVAQAIGRLGNYFNQELFGRPTDLPWAVEIDPDQPNTVAGATTYHPTFLYELLWCLALAGLLVVVDRRFRLGHGRVFALYVMGYTAGRVWIEMLRIDTANEVLGLRLNVWTSIVVFAGGLLYFLLVRGPRETVVEPRRGGPDGGSGAASDPDAPAGDADDEAADDADDADGPTRPTGRRTGRPTRRTPSPGPPRPTPTRRPATPAAGDDPDRPTAGAASRAEPAPGDAPAGGPTADRGTARRVGSSPTD